VEARAQLRGERRQLERDQKGAERDVAVGDEPCAHIEQQRLRENRERFDGKVETRQQPGPRHRGPAHLQRSPRDPPAAALLSPPALTALSPRLPCTGSATAGVPPARSLSSAHDSAASRGRMILSSLIMTGTGSNVTSASGGLITKRYTPMPAIAGPSASACGN